MKRDLFKTIIQRIESPEAIVITGMRRVGKTTLLKQVYDDLESDNKLFLDLENPVNQSYFTEENFDTIRYQFEVLGIHSKKRAYIFLDEIQYVKNLPSVVKYLMDNNNYKFFLTGSASFYLKNLFSESLAGRKIIYELFPLTFAEYLSLKGEKYSIPRGAITKSLYNTFAPLYLEYVEYGAFPQVVTKESKDEKKEVLADIFSSYFNKEVLTIGQFRSNQTIRDLILLLSARIGSKIEVQKLASELNVSRPSIQEYLAFLEGTYFLALVPPHSTNKDVEIRGAKKVYFCDSGLVNYLGNVDKGALFENTIFHQLRTYGALSYYQRKSGVEIDFIVDKKTGWEVKYKAKKEDKARLERLAREISLSKYNILSFEPAESARYGFQL